MKMKIMTVIGTRPEIIKTWSVVTAANVDPDIEHVLVHAGQHYDYEMSKIFLEELDFPDPDYFLGVGSGSHGEQTAKILIGLEKVIIKEKPSVILVQGDTNTAMAAALIAAKNRTPIGHIEAGLRSFDFTMPEEINRVTIDAISSIFFAPTITAVANLVFEGKSRETIYNHGNTQVDVLNYARKKGLMPPDNIISPYAVVTLHRAENVDDEDRLIQIIEGLLDIKVPIYFSVHPRTRKRIAEIGLLEQIARKKDFHLIDPMGYFSFLGLIDGALLILTDSGGIQEEAAMMGIPCVTIRETTEWPDTVWSGANQLAGHDKTAITRIANGILSDNKTSEAAVKVKDLYKSGAGLEIVKTLKEWHLSNSFKLQSVNMTFDGYPVPLMARSDDENQITFFSTIKFDNNGEFVDNQETQGVQVSRRYKPFKE